MYLEWFYVVNGCIPRWKGRITTDVIWIFISRPGGFIHRPGVNRWTELFFSNSRRFFSKYIFRFHKSLEFHNQNPLFFATNDTNIVLLRDVELWSTLMKVKSFSWTYTIGVLQTNYQSIVIRLIKSYFIWKIYQFPEISRDDKQSVDNWQGIVSTISWNVAWWKILLAWTCQPDMCISNQILWDLWSYHKLRAVKRARQLYFEIVYSRIQYGIEMYVNCAKKTLPKLQVMQNKLLKVLLKYDRHTPMDFLLHVSYHKSIICKLSKCYRL